MAEPLPEPRLRVEPQEIEAARRRFGIHGRYGVFCPGAEYGPAKRWPYFQELSRRLQAQTGDPRLAQRPRRRRRGILGRNLVGDTTLDEAIALIAGADYVVTNDSGLMHIAAALRRPQVALFGSSSPKHTPPLSAAARVIWLGVECSPCFERECPLGHFRCMREMAVETVSRKSRISPRERARSSPTAQDAENAFYEALEHGDLEGMMAVWAEDEEIICVHPTGPRLSRTRTRCARAGRRSSPAAPGRACTSRSRSRSPG